jgi:hypothetical protein
VGGGVAQRAQGAMSEILARWLNETVQVAAPVGELMFLVLQRNARACRGTVWVVVVVGWKCVCRCVCVCVSVLCRVRLMCVSL